MAARPARRCPARQRRRSTRRRRRSKIVPAPAIVVFTSVFPPPSRLITFGVVAASDRSLAVSLPEDPDNERTAARRAQVIERGRAVDAGRGCGAGEHGRGRVEDRPGADADPRPVRRAVGVERHGGVRGSREVEHRAVGHPQLQVGVDEHAHARQDLHTALDLPQRRRARSPVDDPVRQVTARPGAREEIVADDPVVRDPGRGGHAPQHRRQRAAVEGHGRHAVRRVQAVQRGCAGGDPDRARAGQRGVREAVAGRVELDGLGAAVSDREPRRGQPAAAAPDDQAPALMHDVRQRRGPVVLWVAPSNRRARRRASRRR